MDRLYFFPLLSCICISQCISTLLCHATAINTHPDRRDIVDGNRPNHFSLPVWMCLYSSLIAMLHYGDFTADRSGPRAVFGLCRGCLGVLPRGLDTGTCGLDIVHHHLFPVP